MLLARGENGHPFIRCPDSITALRNACPKCGSKSPAKVCRACGVARRNEVQTVPFSATVRECAAWTEAQEQQDKVIVSGTTWDAAVDVCAGWLADPSIHQLAEESERLACLHGTWLDEVSRCEIPVEALIDLAPRGGTPFDNCLCTVEATQDATPAPWAMRAQPRGLHVRAALAHALFAKATADPRQKHLWALVELNGGHMAGHRRAAPDMLSTGETALETLLAAYAQCLKSRRWPAFDRPNAAAPDDWTEVHLEPWMVNPENGSAGYFAITSTQSAQEAAEPAAEDARDAA